MTQLKNFVQNIPAPIRNSNPKFIIAGDFNMVETPDGREQIKAEGKTTSAWNNNHKDYAQHWTRVCQKT